MSNAYDDRSIKRGLEQTRTIERSPLYLPWAQQRLNPFPLASSGTQWGDSPIPWPVHVVAFYVAVYVFTTNNGTNYWTLTLSASSSNNVQAAPTTAAIAADTWTRLAVTTGFVQPATADVSFHILPVATGAPGAIFILPAVAVLRTGN